MYTFSLIGLGFISSRHIKAIQDTGNKLLWGCDIDERTESKLPKGTRFYESLKEFLADPNREVPDYFVIATPNYLHFPQFKELLYSQCGCSVGKNCSYIIEKPVCISKEDYKELCEYQSLGVDINILMQLRYVPKLIELQKEISSDGKYHKAIYNTLVHRGEWYFDTWKGKDDKSGGLKLNIGIHYFDLLTWLLGPVESFIEAHLTDRYSSGSMNFKNGIAKWELSLLRKRDEQERKFSIDDKNIDLMALDFENLHTYCYKEILKGNGVKPLDIKDTMDFLLSTRS